MLSTAIKAEPISYSERVDQAIAFAAIAHAGQRRKYTGEPYICHPIEVMQLVALANGEEDLLIAAVLHDVIEDTPVTHREIRRRFGERVEAIVVGLTEVPIDGNRATRKNAERVRLSLESAEVQIIKCADLISNTLSIVEHDPGFARVYLREKTQLLVSMTKAQAHPLWLQASAQIQEINHAQHEK